MNLLKKNNPTKTNSWQYLSKHFQEIKHVHLKDLFAKDADRQKKFTVQTDFLHLDFSKNRITEKTLVLLLDFAKEMNLKTAIKAYFQGEKINETEKRAVLHTALRSKESKIEIAGKNIIPQIQNTLLKIEILTKAVLSGKWKGYTGKKITDIVNIGIGGSDLGPQMVVEALQFYKTPLQIHFVSNIDGDHLFEVLKKINPETTLFILVSKTFTTQETLTNAKTTQNWFLQHAKKRDIPKHFIAVSTNKNTVLDFGITKENIFPMWDWVGGRFSLWSAVGISISLAVGFENFQKLLAGAEKMDTHFKTIPFEKNIPVLLALIGIWYNNFFGCETEAILPYAQLLEKLPAYLQQAVMESNGKSVDRNGEKIHYQTSGIIWGSTGTNMQHAFMQLIHQGTKLIPCDFIGYEKSICGNSEHHQKLMANFYGQTQALCFGKSKEEVVKELKEKNCENISEITPFKIFEGNKPCNIILQKKLSPESLGSLIAMYEHKIFTQGVLWNIFSFDQWGVELGKVLAAKIYKKFNQIK